jgi:hypothetical protein
MRGETDVGGSNMGKKKTHIKGKFDALTIIFFIAVFFFLNQLHALGQSNKSDATLSSGMSSNVYSNLIILIPVVLGLLILGLDLLLRRRMQREVN